MTDCSSSPMQFQGCGRREVAADFSGGTLTSDGGGLLLREVDARIALLSRFAACFTDHRDAERIEHTVESLVSQRVYALALGYEDLNDHDSLRADPLMALLSGKADVEGQDRLRERDRGKALAGKSTLNRLELTLPDATAAERYKKIVLDSAAVDRLLVALFIESFPEAPERIVLDFDATDDPLHGNQEERFFHGYYGQYCYLPLYVFCGEHLLCARLRASNRDAASGALVELKRIVEQVREHWKNTVIVMRGDSGFCREELMAWCEATEGVEYLFGLARNARLEKTIEPQRDQARERYEQTQQAARVFTEFDYRTKKSWSRARRVIAKAEHLDKGPNPRFIVTSLGPEEYGARELYEDHYCARGEMENRIKEQQLDMFADRTSTGYLRANQLRLYFSSMAYTLVAALRRIGLAGTDMARAQCGTVRLRLFKIGARIRTSVRRVYLSLASGFPLKEIFLQALKNIQSLPRPPLLKPQRA